MTAEHTIRVRDVAPDISNGRLPQAAARPTTWSEYMAWHVENPNPFFIEVAYSLYNKTRAAELPMPGGLGGINVSTWAGLIQQTWDSCARIGFAPANRDINNLAGLCIYASVVAAKFYSYRMGYHSSRVVRVNNASDHYFVVARNGSKNPVVVDITCNQFKGPSYIVGDLRSIKGVASQYKAGGTPLYELYKLGVATNTWVI